MKARVLACTVGALVSAMGFATPSQASTLALIAPFGFVSAFQGQNGCDAAYAPGAGPSAGLAIASRAQAASKASAILGGQVSQLEKISQEQAAGVPVLSAPVAAAETAPAIAPPADRRPEPGAAGIDCARLSLPRAETAFVGPADNSGLLRSGDYLMSRRLPVQHTVFDREWDRVRSGGVSRSVVRQFSAVTHISGGAVDDRVLAAVNGWTNQHVRYREDSQLYGRADYWANAQSTFRRGAGDCEDIAIAKMQLLARLGVPQSDMFLTIARDLARNADHAMLIVRRGDRYWLLDNGTDRVLDASANYDYRPIMSFSGDHKWLHGYVTAQLGLN